jgi:hypothetical protein
MSRKIYVFDFDGTLFYTPEPEEGKKTFKMQTNIDWPHRGWWSKKETLDQDIFHIPMNQWVYRQYLKSISENALVVLATGRMEKLRKEVESILNSNNLSFDEIHLNPGMDTFLFKAKLFEKLIEKCSPDILTMYDDRVEHLIKFREWAKTQPCQVDIIDVNRKIKL